MKGWLVDNEHPDVQVVPIDDLITHAPHHCPCDPMVEYRGFTACTSAGHKLRIRAVVSHRAMDGRA